MCARYTLTKGSTDLIGQLPGISTDIAFPENYNVAPTHAMPVITADDPGRIELMHFGLVPHWAKDKKVGYSMLNARKESLLEKPSFKPLMVKNKRCLPVCFRRPLVAMDRSGYQKSLPVFYHHHDHA